MKVGEVLLDSGTGAVDTEAQVRYVAATYGIDAFRSAIAGIYEADILRELGMLLLFAIPALILGLFLRPAMDNYHKRLQKAIKKTKVMA